MADPVLCSHMLIALPLASVKSSQGLYVFADGHEGTPPCVAPYSVPFMKFREVMDK